MGKKVEWENRNSTLGVSLFEYGFQAVHGQVGVHLRGRKAGVAQQFLDGVQVGPLAQQVGGEGVAQRVRVLMRHRGRHLTQILFDGAIHQLFIERRTLVGAQQRPACVRPKLGGAGGAVFFQHPQQRGVQGHEALLVALARYAHGAPGPVQVTLTNAQQLGEPDAGAVERFEHELVAHPGKAVGKLKRVEQPVQGLFGHKFGQLLGHFGGLDAQHGVGLDTVLAQQKLVERAQASHLAVHGARVELLPHQLHHPAPNKRVRGLRQFSTSYSARKSRQTA